MTLSLIQAVFIVITGGQTHNYCHYFQDSLIAIALHALAASGLITARTGCGFRQSEHFITR